MQDKLTAFRSLYLEHAEDMVILAYLLLDDPQLANSVVEAILMDIWEANCFEIDTAVLYGKVRASCSEIIASHV
jgi:hypothetical protein